MSVIHSFRKRGSKFVDHNMGLLPRPAAPPAEFLMASEAISAAGLDWEVAKEPLQPDAGRPAARPAKSYALVRTAPQHDSHRVTLGQVAEDYTPLQNREAFALFDPLVQAGAAVFDSAGEFDRGRRVWAFARLLKPGRINHVDCVQRFLLLVNNHSGFSPQIQMRLTPVRVSCENMLAVVLRLGKDVLTEPAGDVRAQLRQAAERLRVIEQDFATVESEFRRMADTPMTSQRVTEYLAQVLPEPSRNRPEVEHQLLRRLREEASRLFESGKGNDQPGIRGTLWAAYNGVTELVDHHIADGSPEAKLQRIWFGNGHEVKLRAYKVALRWLRMVTRADNWRFADNRSELARLVERRVPLEAMGSLGGLPQ